jgi:23S rRNA (cytidine2498-2'-O)-methyltransferase
MDIFTCQPGYEPQLADEIRARGGGVQESGTGWVRTADAGPGEWCYAHLALRDAMALSTSSLNVQVAWTLDFLLGAVQGVRLPDAWPLCFRACGEGEGLGRRVRTVEKEFRARLKRKASRLERAARNELARGGGGQVGLFVLFADFDRMFAATAAWAGGQQRMADDPLAPSRSYLKAEEAYVVLGAAPVSGESVVDLGAAPGGWCYSAAKRGARVTAVDNAALKDGAKEHPCIEHRREDAFRFRPSPGTVYDWLFCDMVEEPHHVLRLVAEWLRDRRCRRFVVNLKTGRADAVKLLDASLSGDGPLRPYCRTLRARHLYHDRDEFTLVGEAGMG